MSYPRCEDCGMDVDYCVCMIPVEDEQQTDEPKETEQADPHSGQAIMARFNRGESIIDECDMQQAVRYEPHAQ